MQTPEMIGLYRPPLPTPMPVMETYRPSMGPPGPSMGLPGSSMGPPGSSMGLPGSSMGPPGPSMGLPGSSMGPPGHHIEPTWQHMGPSGQHKGPAWQHIGPAWQHIGPAWQHMGPPGPSMGPPGQYMEPSQPGMEPSWQHMGPSGQHMGHLGLGMGPTGPNTSFLGTSGSQMGSLEMPPIPQVQPVIPNYSVPNPNLYLVQPVDQSAADNLWVKNMTPTVQLQPKQTEVTGHNTQPLKLYFDHFKTHLPSAMVQPAVQSAVVRPQIQAFLEDTEASQAQTSVQQNAAKDVNTESEVSSDESEEEVVEKKKKQQNMQKKPEPKAEQKPGPKSRPVTSTPIPDTVWSVVQTNNGKHFFYNPTKRQSVWKMPEELKNRPDVLKLLSPKPEVKTKIKEEKDLQEEPPSKKIKLEVEVNREKEEVTQEIVLEKETTNTVKVQTTENMPVVSLEDRKKKFKKLLADNNVSTCSTWGKELHKVVFDKNYMLLTSRERKQAFEEYVNDRAEEESKERKGKSKLFIQLLEESNVNVKSTFKSFAAVHSDDERFKMILTPHDREHMFEDYINELVQKEKKKNALIREKMKDDFMKMLREIPDIDPSTSWVDVKKKVSSDPRYKAVSDSHQEEWFTTFLKTMIEVKRDFMKMLSEIPGIDLSTCWRDVKNKVSSESRYKAVSESHQEEWFKMYLKAMKEVKDDFMKKLSEIPDIDPSTSWGCVKNKVSTDPRYEAVSDSRREEWFKAYFKTVKEVKGDFMKKLSEIPGIDTSTSWGDVKNKVSSDPRYKVVNDSHREEWFKMYLKTMEAVKDDFMKMLSEIPGIDLSTSWGDVKNKVSSDPRYKAISESHQEEWFKMYLKTMKEVKEDFIKMLSEIPGIEPSSFWVRDVKHKVCCDPRYMAVSDSHRVKWFEAYLKTMKEVKDDFMIMLSEIPDIDPSTSWDDVQNIVSSDSRYKAVSDFHREEWFKAYLKTMMKVKSDFMKILSEVPGIDLCTSWGDVKNKVSSDPRYKTVSESRQEEWFKMYVKKVKGDFMKMLIEIPEINPSTSWGYVKLKVYCDPRYKVVSDFHREEWFNAYLKSMMTEKDDFMKMLMEIPEIDPSTSWDDVKNKLSSDPRYKAVSDSHREEWFQAYLFTMMMVQDDFMKMLSEIPGIEPSTTWNDVKNIVSTYPRFKAVSDSRREEWFKTYLNTLKEVKDDFMKVLSEIPDIDTSTSWRDVKNKVSSDPRYKVVSDSRLVKWFEAYMNTVKEVKGDFIKMLSEIPGICPSTNWGDVEIVVSSDPRYMAVSDSRREECFKTYLKTVTKVEDDFMKMLSEIPGIDPSTGWGDMENKVSSDHRYKAVSGSRREVLFKTYLEVKDDFLKMLTEIPGIEPSTSWVKEVKYKVCYDPRFKAVRDSCLEEWFKTYLKALKEVKDDFMKMLSELPGIDPSTSWDDVKNKVSSDPRYKAVSDSRREEWFKMYLKTIKDVEDDFMKMLSEIPGIDTCTSWHDVKNKVRSDPRYMAVNDTRHEELFKTYLEVKGDFMKMLSELPGIEPSTSWCDVKYKVYYDPRFKAVTGSCLEEWFKTYLKSIKEVKGDFMKMLSEIPDIDPSTSWNDVKYKVSSDPRCKAVSDSRGEVWFKTHLKTVKGVQDDFMKMLSKIPDIDPSTSWGDVKNKVSTDPRFEALSDSRREEWFNTCLNTLEEVKVDFMKMLSEMPGKEPNTSWWKDVKYKVCYDPRFKAVSGSCLEEWFKTYLKAMNEVKDDFMKMLSGIPQIDTRTRWRSVKNKVSSDPRFKAVSDSCRVAWFKMYLKTVKEVKYDFMKMLSVIPDINPSASWADVKTKVSSDTRYKAVNDSRLEEWFKTYLEIKDDFMKMLSGIPGIYPCTRWDYVKKKVCYNPQFRAVSDSCQQEWFKTYLKAKKEVKEDFIKMLSEIPGIDSSTSWDNVKNKVSSDSRYKAVSDSHREEWFKIYLKTMKKVKDDFMKMLSEIPDINPSTSWVDVKNKVSSDPRYKAVSDSCLEEWFKTYLKMKDDFMKMLSGIPGIDPSTSWDDVKKKVSSDPRYNAVSDSCLEEWFKMYLKTMKNVKDDFMKMLSEIPGIDPSTSWDDVNNKVSSDPRYNAVSDSLREEWFKMYFKTMKNVKDDFMKMLREIPDINPSTSWADVKNKVSSDPRYNAVSDSCLEEWFKTYLKVKNDFMKMLSETPGIVPYMVWSNVSSKLYSDPRYKAVVIESCRIDWFYDYLRTENVVKDDFLKMLGEIPDIDPSTSWDDVKNKVSSDPPFKAVSDTRQEEWFKTYLKTLKEVKDEFMKILSEIPGIDPSTSWDDVKNKVSSDPRYKAISDTRQEEWFKAYLKTLKEVIDFMKILSEIPGINCSTSWSDVKNKVSSDPRYEAVVSDSHQEEWFMAYLETLKDIAF